MDPFSVLEHLRADYPTMSGAALILSGCGLGWAVAWLFLKQRLTHQKEVVEHYKDLVVGKFGLLESRTESRREGSQKVLAKVVPSGQLDAATAQFRKGYIQVSSKYLMTLYDGKTQLQGDALGQAYIGQRMAVRCTINDVIADGDNVVVIAHDAYTSLIIANFGAGVEEVRHLSKGDAVEIGGRIHSIMSLMLTLRDCETIADRATKP